MIIVTGATGNIGSELIRLLAERGAEVKAISRRPPPDVSLPGLTWVAADLLDREALPDIFAGADRLFLLTGNVEDFVRIEKNAIAAAQSAGISRVVKLSALGASDHSKSVIGTWHYATERVLRESGLDWTILRPHVFMQNLLEQRSTIQAEGKIYSAAGDASIPMIDTRDISEVAAVVLTEPGHEGKRYTLTGPAPISYAEAAAILSDVLGRPVEYVAETDDEAWTRLRRSGLAPWQIAAQLSLAGYQRQGGGTGIITDAVEKITGRKPRTFAEFARDHAEEFLRP